MPVNYYIKRGEKFRGPLSGKQIQNLKAQGKLKASDLISNRSDGGWKPAQGGSNRSAVAIPELPPKRAPQTMAAKANPEATKRGRGLLLRSVAVVGIVLISAALWLLWPSNTPTIAQTLPEGQPSAGLMKRAAVWQFG